MRGCVIICIYIFKNETFFYCAVNCEKWVRFRDLRLTTELYKNIYFISKEATKQPLTKMEPTKKSCEFEAEKALIHNDPPQMDYCAGSICLAALSPAGLMGMDEGRQDRTFPFFSTFIYIWRGPGGRGCGRADRSLQKGEEYYEISKFYLEFLKKIKSSNTYSLLNSN